MCVVERDRWVAYFLDSMGITCLKHEDVVLSSELGKVKWKIPR